MAGSYNHVVTDDGNLVANEYFPNVIENLGDAYEMAEEMYGMIWWLASRADSVNALPEIVRQARQNYEQGLAFAREANRAR